MPAPLPKIAEMTHMTIGRFLLACWPLWLSACGGLVDGGPDDAATAVDSRSVVDTGGTSPSTDASTSFDTAPIVPGCPAVPPKPGQRCASTYGPDVLEHFICSYFAKGDSCATDWMCSGIGTGRELAFGVGVKNCAFAPERCVEGKACGSVDPPSGACIVECDHICHCDYDFLRCGSTPPCD